MGTTSKEIFLIILDGSTFLIIFKFTLVKMISIILSQSQLNMYNLESLSMSMKISTKKKFRNAFSIDICVSALFLIFAHYITIKKCKWRYKLPICTIWRIKIIPWLTFRYFELSLHVKARMNTDIYLERK